ncbi:MAG: Hsp70 family protein, partial [Verrucomicrobiales bacterium]
MAKYSIGIDLGTTHSALSYFPLEAESGRGSAQTTLPIPQLIKSGVVDAKPLLPSFLYLPNENEFPPESLALPWEDSQGEIVGEFARLHGSKVPSRLVSSAKSWLCHPGVDRTGALLPWQAPDDVKKVSPLEASSRYLKHLRQAWDQQFGEAGDLLADQEVVLTVPASFDAAARELTLQAAVEAGLPNVTLLEEPQAAFYAWVELLGESYRKQVSVGDVVLVVDVGGGTTDLSLIAVTEQSGNAELNRLAVGDHILLGGDNMDLTLAHTLNQKLAAEGKKLDAWQFNSLTFGCRQAKEALFADAALTKMPIAIPSRGSALIGGTIKTELDRETLEKVLTDGFFPRTDVSELPQTGRKTGLAQMALPYAQDAAVTRHIAAFLTRQAKALSESETPLKLSGRGFLHPTAILFNGGVFKAAPLRN